MRRTRGRRRASLLGRRRADCFALSDAWQRCLYRSCPGPQGPLSHLIFQPHYDTPGELELGCCMHTIPCAGFGLAGWEPVAVGSCVCMRFEWGADSGRSNIMPAQAWCCLCSMCSMAGHHASMIGLQQNAALPGPRSNGVGCSEQATSRLCYLSVQQYNSTQATCGVLCPSTQARRHGHRIAVHWSNADMAKPAATADLVPCPANHRLIPHQLTRP